MSTASSQTFGLRDLLDAAKHALPGAPQKLSSLIQLATLKPTKNFSIGLLLEQQAAARPTHPFLRFEGRTWTYGEFNTWVNRLAHLFKAQGLKTGDCVAVMFENRPEVLACVLATVKLGGVAGLINFNQRGDVLAHSLRLVNPRIVVVGSECQAAFDEIASSLPSGIQLFWQGDGDCPAPYRNLDVEGRNQPAINPPDTQDVKLGQRCYYIFTSGTTGLPKAAAMTHMRWYKSSIGLGKTAMQLRADDVLYCPLPLYHNNALTVALSSVMGSGATLALARKFSVSRFWDDIRETRATAFIYIGELCRYLLNRPQSDQDRNHRLRVIIGNGMRPEVWDEFQQRFGVKHICEFYGASECNLAFVNAFNLPRTAGFCPLKYAVVAFDQQQEEPVRNHKGYMRRVKRGDVGLLLSEVSERVPFDGYTDPKANEAKLLRNVFKKGDVWFNTGDLVRDQGFRHIAFVDRVGDTFRWKGENVATTEVEGALIQCPGVAEAAVYGVAVPKADGRAGMAALTLEPDARFDAQAIYAHLRQALPSYAIPLFVRLQDQQETTSTFKLRKVELKQQAFDPDQVRQPLYVLLDRNKGYEPLTPDIYAAIERGEKSF